MEGGVAGVECESQGSLDKAPDPFFAYFACQQIESQYF